MGDMGDYWKDVKPFMKEQSRERRERNYFRGMEALSEARVQFEEKPGPHIVIRHEGFIYDYWPTTGKWVKREPNPCYKRGLAHLLSALGVGKIRKERP